LFEIQPGPRLGYPTLTLQTAGTHLMPTDEHGNIVLALKAPQRTNIISTELLGIRVYGRILLEEDLGGLLLFTKTPSSKEEMGLFKDRLNQFFRLRRLFSFRFQQPWPPSPWTDLEGSTRKGH
jgi:hypothetical protein